ncbi:unnamed protein product [Amoebophrya sp. A25]|nr:unnamed protein product [Amoebophrya sp. A25]|eukprot:GSA25T00015035001.1
MSIPGVPNSPSGMPMRRQVKRDTTEFEDYLSGQSYVAHVSFAFRSGLDGHNYESEPDAFADWIRDHLFLESIDLRGIEPTKDEVLIKIGKGLAGNRSIACLNFTHNNLGQKDVRGFLLALAENVSIWRLELHKNQIDVNGAKAIAEFMRENVGVTHLNLSHNPLIGEEGARHILEAFAENGSIYVMKLAGCNCGEELLAAINRCCRRNRAAVAYKMEADAPQENKRTGGS